MGGGKEKLGCKQGGRVCVCAYTSEICMFHSYSDQAAETVMLTKQVENEEVWDRDYLVQLLNRY